MGAKVQKFLELKDRVKQVFVGSKPEASARPFDPQASLQEPVIRPDPSPPATTPLPDTATQPTNTGAPHGPL
jgi:hypothetical protein